MGFLKKFFLEILKEEKTEDKKDEKVELEIKVKVNDEEIELEDVEESEKTISYEIVEDDDTYCKIEDPSKMNEYEEKLYNKYYDNVGKEINGWKILDYKSMVYQNYLLPFYDCECVNCSKKGRIDAIDILADYGRPCYYCRPVPEQTYKPVVVKKKIEIPLNDIGVEYIDSFRNYIGKERIGSIGRSYECISKFYIENGDKYRLVGVTKVVDITPQYMIFNYSVPFGENVTIENLYRCYNRKSTLCGDFLVYFKINGVYKIFIRSEEIIKESDIEGIKVIGLTKNDDKIDLIIYETGKKLKRISNIEDIRTKIGENVFLVQREGKMFLLDTEKEKLYDFQVFEKDGIYHMEDTFTNIEIDIEHELINEKLKQLIKPYLDEKLNFTESKQVFFEKDITQKNMVLCKYLSDFGILEDVETEFEDDKAEHCCVNIKWEDEDKIEFCEYIIELAQTGSDKYKYKYTIYGYTIDRIISAILADVDIKIKLCELLRNKELLIVEDETKIENIIYWIIIRSGSELDNNCFTIVEKLCNKYNLNKFELLILLIAKYREDNIFSFPRIKNLEFTEMPNGFSAIKQLFDKKACKAKYDKILSELDEKEIKWKSEFKMFKLIKSHFEEAIYQYRFKELGLQSLDVFIPELNIGFEYQGIQHYQAVEVFGGEEHYQIQHENDIKKKKICKENNIELIEWKYDEEISKINLDKKLIKYKERLEGKYVFSELE